MKLQLHCKVGQIKIKARIKSYSIKAKINKITPVFIEKETVCNLIWASNNW